VPNLLTAMTAIMPSSPQDEHFNSFRHHCRLFYQRSLSIHDSTLQHPQPQQQKQKQQQQQQQQERSVQHNEEDSAAAIITAETQQESKIILEALEHHIVNAHSENLSEEFLEFLTRESVQPHLERLKACGLLPSVLHSSSSQPLLSCSPSSSSSSLEIISSTCVDKEDVCHEEKAKNCSNNVTQNGIVMPHELLMKYVQIRNEERRNAHEKQMYQRQIYLNQLIQDLYQLNDPEDNVCSEEVVKEKVNGLNNNAVTTQLFLKTTKRQIQNFVSNYKHNIGTHSFLAGLRALIELQLKHDESIILWTFHGSTLTEVNLDATQQDSTTTSWTKKNGGNYIKDAMDLLKAFMIYHENGPDESEKGSSQKLESTVSFHIDNGISNRFLGHLLIGLPKACDLHTKPAGKLTVLDNMDKDGIRKNPKGDQDEDYWASWMTMIPWSSSGFHCDIL
jgi:hypothetical protein